MQLDDRFIQDMGPANPPPNVAIHRSTKVFTPPHYDYMGGSGPTQLGDGTFWNMLGADCGKKQFGSMQQDTAKRILPQSGDPRDKQFGIDFAGIKRRHQKESGFDENESVSGESTTSTVRINRQISEEQRRLTNLRGMKVKRFVPLSEEEEKELKEIPKLHYKPKFPTRRVPSVLAYTGRIGSAPKLSDGLGALPVGSATATATSGMDRSEQETERKKAIVNKALTAKPKYIASLKGSSQRIIEMQAEMKLKVPADPFGVPRTTGVPEISKSANLSTPTPIAMIPRPPTPSSARIPQPPPPIKQNNKKADGRSEVKTARGVSNATDERAHKVVDRNNDVQAAGHQQQQPVFSWRAKYKNLVKAIDEERQVTTQVHAMIHVLKDDNEKRELGVDAAYLRK